MALAAIGLPLVLAACSSDSSNGWSLAVDVARDAFDRSDSVTLEQAAAVPYATIGVRIGDGPQFMLALATDANGQQLWTSSARIALTTQNGRIVTTSGLPADLSGTLVEGTDPLASFGSAPLRGHGASTRLMDFIKDARFSIPVTCTLRPRGEDKISILGTAIDTRQFDEDCMSSAIDWSFTNTYWVGNSGLIWKSIQHVHPDADPVEIEILRPQQQMAGPK